MCDPLSAAAAASVALTTAGGAYRGMTQRRYQKALSASQRESYLASLAAREEERTRQEALENEGAQSLESILGTMGRDSGDAEKSAATRSFMDSFAALPRAQGISEQGGLLPGQGSSSVEVRDWVAREAGKAASDASKRIAAMAQLSGLSTAGGRRVNRLGDAQNTLSTLNGIRRGSLGVSRQEQGIRPDAVTPGSTVLGDIMTGVGLLSGVGAFSSIGGGGGGSTPGKSVY